MNEILLFTEIVIVFGGLLLIKKFIGLNGIYAWACIATCLAEIQACKSVVIFGIDATMGNVLFASTFLATDMIRESYGDKESKKAVLFIVLGALSYLIFSILTPLSIPADFDIAQPAMKVLLGLSVRVTGASIVCLLIANWVDVVLYSKLYEKAGGKKLWVRNNICTILCNCLENFLFTFLAFGGIYDFNTLITIALFTSVIEIVIALFDTPFLYISKAIN